MTPLECLRVLHLLYPYFMIADIVENVAQISAQSSEHLQPSTISWLSQLPISPPPANSGRERVMPSTTMIFAMVRIIKDEKKTPELKKEEWNKPLPQTAINFL